MLKTMLTSKAAKLACACACPVVGAGTVTMAVPEVKQAVHKATAPRAYAKPKMRKRVQPAVARAASPIDCPPPIVLAAPTTTFSQAGPLLAPELDLASLATLPVGPVAGRSGPIGFSPGFPGISLPGVGGIPAPGVTPPGPGEPPPGSSPPIIEVPSAVPAPASWGMMIVGFGAMGYYMRKPRKAEAESLPTA